jgi:hypothetical protein
MTSDDFLINHAYAKAWCAPEQDRQHIFRPARLSPPIGVRGSTDLIWTRYQLPTQGDWYHLYQVGPVIFSNLGLTLTELSWTAASQQMVLERMVIDVYTESGLMVPRELVFFLATPDGNLAIAVKDTKLLGDFGSEPLFFRFYSNAYFEKADSNDLDEGIEYRYMVPVSTDNISTISKIYRDMMAKTGYTYAFVNGRKVQSINVATVQRGDMVEVVRDSSIREVIEFPVAQLEVFLSNLDAQQKYFLHQTAKTDDFIDYRDDLDIFLIKRVNVNGYTGVYYHKNAEDSLRMVTHRDYSIPVQYVERYAALHPTMSVINELTVQLVIRHGGMDKPLIDEAHHIRELYKLSDTAFMDAVIGTEATVSVWKAAALEDSMYPAIMRAPDRTITRDMVEAAYGYNAISKLLADTPQKVVNANRWVELPFGLRGQSTVYEYDANGLLLGWFINTNVQWYVARNVNCKYIEAFVGKGGRTSSTVFGGDAEVSTIYNYRCYVCNMVNGFPDDRWIDVTGDEAYYSVVGKNIVWAVDRKKFYTAIKLDDSFLTYNLDLDYPDGLLRFSLNVEEVRLDGTPYLNLSEIPMGVLELWLNGHSLIEGLDWFMNGKEVCIVNKVWRTRDGSPNRITIRGTGFCNKDMSRVKQSEFGYVEQGWLSRNNRWNLRDDKVIRVTAGGRIYERTDLDWVEDKPGVKLNNVDNGAPYQVIEPIIPLRGVTLDDTYAMRMLAEATDKEIEDYMTEKMGQPVIDGPNIIPGPHVLYSPFISKIMHDLDEGYIPETEIDNAAYSDNLVKQLAKPYEWLLPYEPTSKNLDPDYVNVHPHESYEPFELGLYQYNFLRRVIRIYLKDKVNISQFISIRPLA